MESTPYCDAMGLTSPKTSSKSKGEDPGSSPDLLPVMQQPTRSEFSFNNDSSSIICTRTITRGVYHEIQSPSATGGVEGDQSQWSLDDLLPEHRPLSAWKPADYILQASSVLESPTPESPTLHLTDEASGRYPPPAESLSPSKSKEPSTIGPVTPVTPEEEKFRLRQMKEPRINNWEVLDLGKTSRARLYHYYTARLDNLKILCDNSQKVTGFPLRCEEDYALLKTITKTYGNERWWTIMIDDLMCPGCVLFLRERRKNPKVRYYRPIRHKGHIPY